MTSWTTRYQPVTQMQPNRTQLNEDSIEHCADPVSRRFVCKTGGSGVRKTLLDLKKLVDAYNGLTPELKSNSELVLAEVLNNIEEHSYGGQSGCDIWVEVALTQNSIAVATRDLGAPMPGLQLPAKRLPPYQVPRDALPEGGFGWYLIHSLAPNPSYSRQGDANLLQFVLGVREKTAEPLTPQ